MLRFRAAETQKNNQKQKFMTYFYHIEWIFDNYDLNILESTDLQIPNHHILIQILSWVKLIPRNCNFTGWALAVSASKVKPRSFFLMYYGVSNCFRSQHLSFCLHWVTTSTCSTMCFFYFYHDNLKHTLRTLTIVLEGEGAIEWKRYDLSLAYDLSPKPIFEKRNLIKGLY